MQKGIDVASWQGVVDFGKVKAAGYDFVIIKAGQGLVERESFRRDPQYQYQPRAQAAGMDWGAYWWSDADTVEGAKAEAQAFIKTLEGLRPTFPVYMDQEYGTPADKLGLSAKARQLRTDMVKAFLDALEDAGYYAGLYTSLDWINTRLYDEQLTDYDKWIAQYNRECQYKGDYGIWQFTNKGVVDGIGPRVDVNECYKDYPGIIKGVGLNGWPGELIPEPPAGRLVTWGEAGDILKAAGVTEIRM